MQCYFDKTLQMATNKCSQVLCLGYLLVTKIVFSKNLLLWKGLGTLNYFVVNYTTIKYTFMDAFSQLFASYSNVGYTVWDSQTELYQSTQPKDIEGKYWEQRP